ncbi:MAG: HEAT repeat domain-containing protein [Anaerolineae bacterium]|nr:HEAT repeat domain-containing protein [Anaerolineae bacterium]MDW8172965.1 HEAT repeat domain-containing protein [Anaerolineae bacterium]
MDYDVSALLNDLLTHAEADVRRNCAWQLGRLRQPVAVPALSLACADPDAGVRLRAYEALAILAEHADARAYAALLGGLRDVDAEARALACVSLRAFAPLGRWDETTLSALLASLDDPESVVRAAAAESLGQALDPQVWPALAACLRDDPDAGVRYAARQALLNGGGAAGQALLAALPASDDPVVLADLLEALGQVGQGYQPADLQPWLTHADEAVRVAAHWAAGRV